MLCHQEAAKASLSDKGHYLGFQCVCIHLTKEEILGFQNICIIDDLERKILIDAYNFRNVSKTHIRFRDKGPNFADLESTDPKFTELKDLNPLKKHAKNQETS